MNLNSINSNGLQTRFRQSCCLDKCVQQHITKLCSAMGHAGRFIQYLLMRRLNILVSSFSYWLWAVARILPSLIVAICSCSSSCGGDPAWFNHSWQTGLCSVCQYDDVTAMLSADGSNQAQPATSLVPNSLPSQNTVVDWLIMIVPTIFSVSAHGYSFISLALSFEYLTIPVK